jgi:hypothetical protein
LKVYLEQTSGLKYSYLSCLPLLVMYEVLIIISQPGEEAVVRLTADIWIRQLLFLIHDNTLVLTFLLAAVLGGWIFWKERSVEIAYKKSWFAGMIAESAVWAVLLAVLVSGVTAMLFGISAGLWQPMLAGTGSEVTRLQMLALSVGAGLYEELIFRVVLVISLIWLFGKFMERGYAVALAVVLAAALFSGVHYTGSLGDPFTLSSFVFRMLFGLALNGLLVVRGFGITAWTHSLYDVLLVMFFWP